MDYKDTCLSDIYATFKAYIATAKWQVKQDNRWLCRTEGFVSEYILLDFSCERIPTSQQMFNAGTSFPLFYFGINSS